MDDLNQTPSTSSAPLPAATAAESMEDEYEEKIMVLQLDGVLDFEAIKRAVQSGAFRVREPNSEKPLIQVFCWGEYIHKLIQIFQRDKMF